MKVINLKEKTSRLRNKVVGSVMGVDLFDGQKRGEVIARRVLILVLLILAIYVLLDLLVDKGWITTNEQRQVQATTQTITQAPVVPLEIREVSPVAQQTTPQKQEVLKAPQPLTDNIEKYIARYGGEYDTSYIKHLRNYCDIPTLKLVVAISVAETGMGKTTDRNTNYFGYFYNGNRSYDPSQEEMAKVICRGIGKYYSDVATNYEKAKRYTGNDHTTTWMGNVQKALLEMN